MHPQRLFLLYVVPNSGKRYWDRKLPYMEAQIELFSTFVYDQKMSTSRQLCEEIAPQPGGTNDNDAHVCEPICINMCCRAKHNNQEKNPFVEGRSDKNFRVVNLFKGSILGIILFCTMMLFGSQAWSSLSFVPPPFCARKSLESMAFLVLPQRE